MFGPILDLIKTRTARHTFLLFFGTVASKGVGFLILFFLAHLMSREDYATFGMVMTIMWFVYEFSELGMNTTLVRAATEHIEAGRNERGAGLFRLMAL